ncbi:MAG: hypothetical protein B6I26_00045 [Desulfobacteraceae bacterium 4572_130]|nr:MAG: hypothetical protein B6I26_00045 [Desulfobacteraceae bacterium 4572_130]
MKKLFLKFILIFIIMIFYSTHATAEIKKIIIIPFKINSRENITYISEGVFQMLLTRLSWKDKVLVAGKDEVKQALAKCKNVSENRLPFKIANLINSNYVLNGSITQFAGAFSLDINIFNIKNKTSQFFFTQAQTMEKIIPELSILAAKINKKIFNRTTETFENIEQNTIQSVDKNIRANPEKLMEQQIKKIKLKDAPDQPFWKFWIDNNKKEYQEYQTVEEKEDKPFWKFW